MTQTLPGRGPHPAPSPGHRLLAPGAGFCYAFAQVHVGVHGDTWIVQLELLSTSRDPPSGRVFPRTRDIYCSRGRDPRRAGLRPQNRRACHVWRGSGRQTPAVHCLLVFMGPVICLRTAVPGLS